LRHSAEPAQFLRVLRTRVSVIVVALGLFVSLGLPAGAFSSSYCGHGTTGLFSKVVWLYSVNSNGYHLHYVEHFDAWTGGRHYTYHVC
jgi:hypothetical protein